MCGDNSIENSLPTAESTRLETDDFDIPASFEISTSLYKQAFFYLVFRSCWMN